ncbi:SURF1-like protein [Lysobacter bugurensis]|uniref:SURF1-like protein n=1 Tax=Cognatilysobacter bugurensis TaxID=543356 RepID=A0A918SYF3_9GAMM|nr:SURF1-like protein [Lysobacter bugurensis]
MIAGWLFALALCAGFASLGAWQLSRADEKQLMLDRADAVLSRRKPQGLTAAQSSERAGDYDWARGSGRFMAQSPVLLDNQQRNGRVGVRVYRAFQPDAGGEPLLVDLGWLPWPGDRRLPAAALAPPAPGSVELHGLLAPPPSPGLALGEAVAARADAGGATTAWLATRLDRDALARALGVPALAPRVLRLDPALRIGFERDLVLLANTLPPTKHRGYAVQWFGLALATLITALVLTFRSLRR